MQSIADNRLETLMLRGDVIRKLGRLYYLAGRQGVVAGVNRDLVEELSGTAVTQGTQSSNYLEGIAVAEERYQPLMQNRIEPVDRTEKLILGYRDTLSFIHKAHERIEVTPETVVDLHRRMYAHTGEPAGKFREKDNKIVRVENGIETVVFVPPPHGLVAWHVASLCAHYKRLRQGAKTDEFLLMAGFVLDFTCIHPFMDGNGRVSRLLTTLLAYKAGFDVVRYIAHEKLIYDSKQAYYYALTESSRDWLRGAHRWSYWVEYLASVFIGAYENLDTRIQSAGNERGYQTRRIKEVIQELPTKFSIRDIFERLPTAKRPTVNRVISELKAGGFIETVGAGPAAHYRKLSALDR